MLFIYNHIVFDIKILRLWQFWYGTWYSALIKGNWLLGFPLLNRIWNVSTKGIKCTKNRNIHVNKGKLARKSSNCIVYIDDIPESVNCVGKVKIFVRDNSINFYQMGWEKIYLPTETHTYDRLLWIQI